MKPSRDYVLLHSAARSTSRSGSAPHRVDLLIDGWLVIEIDSEEWHSSTRLADSRRDSDLIRRGYRVKHFDYAEVVFGWSKVEATIVELLRNPSGRRYEALEPGLR